MFSGVAREARDEKGREGSRRPFFLPLFVCQLKFALFVTDDVCDALVCSQRRLKGFKSSWRLLCLAACLSLSCRSLRCCYYLDLTREEHMDQGTTHRGSEREDRSRSREILLFVVLLSSAREAKTTPDKSERITRMTHALLSNGKGR